MIRRLIVKLCIGVASKLSPHVAYCSYPKDTPEGARLRHLTGVVLSEKCTDSEAPKYPECLLKASRLIHGGASLKVIRQALDEAEALVK